MASRKVKRAAVAAITGDEICDAVLELLEHAERLGGGESCVAGNLLLVAAATMCRDGDTFMEAAAAAYEATVGEPEGHA